MCLKANYALQTSQYGKDEHTYPKRVFCLLKTLVIHVDIPPERIQRPRNNHAAGYYGYYAAAFFLERDNEFLLNKYHKEQAMKMEE